MVTMQKKKALRKNAQIRVDKESGHVVYILPKKRYADHLPMAYDG